MKKQSFFIFIAAALLTAGCTSPEQDQQIRLFWLQQYTNLMMKKSGRTPSDTTRRMPTTTMLPAAQAPRQEVTPRQEMAPQPQLIDVTMETDALNGKAPFQDRVRMKRAWNAVQAVNQKTVEDIGTAFGEQVKTKAFIITTNTEKQLKQEAKNATDFASYFARQQELLAKQEKDITQLMTQNRGHIKKLKKINTPL
ncbi:MAG: hypothetical protein ACI351_05510 [Candidatus Avelusimicrobium sp.]|uniref:hypothetical protein n=1 Tax=Candidatus Avelusimicrobium sp. TaxID=3048833 RepID=UPI003EFE7EFD